MPIASVAGNGAYSRAIFYTGTGPFTYSCWVKIHAALSTSGRLVTMGSSGGGLAVGVQAAGRNLGMVRESVAWCVGTKTLTDFTWYHVLVRRAAGSQMWVDAVKICDDSGSINTPAGNITLNHNQVDAGAWADFAFWNVALSDDEIIALSRGVNPSLIRRAAIQYYLPLWEALATVPDLSGLGRNVARAGTPTTDTSKGPPLQPLIAR